MNTVHIGKKCALKCVLKKQGSKGTVVSLAWVPGKIILQS